MLEVELLLLPQALKVLFLVEELQEPRKAKVLLGPLLKSVKLVLVQVLKLGP